MAASSVAGMRTVGRAIGLNTSRIIRDEARNIATPASIDRLKEDPPSNVPGQIVTDAVDKMFRSNKIALIHQDNIPESISMLIQHDISVPADILLETLEWDFVLGGDSLPESLQVKVESQYKQLHIYAKGGYNLSPDLVKSILTEFQIWCSMVVPHSMKNADAKSNGLLFEAIEKFNSCGDQQRMTPLTTKLERVQELIDEDKIDDALMLAKRIDEEAHRMKTSLDLIKQDVEEHLKARSALTMKMGLSAFGLAAVHLVADLAGSKADFFATMRASGELLWMAVQQWIGGWEYEQFLINHLRNEIIKQRMVVSMHDALDRALIARTYQKPCNVEATNNIRTNSSVEGLPIQQESSKHIMSEHPEAQRQIFHSTTTVLAETAPASDASNDLTQLRLQNARTRLELLDAMRAEAEANVMSLEESIVMLSASETRDIECDEEEFTEICIA